MVPVWTPIVAALVTAIVVALPYTLWETVPISISVESAEAPRLALIAFDGTSAQVKVSARTRDELQVTAVFAGGPPGQDVSLYAPQTMTLVGQRSYELSFHSPSEPPPCGTAWRYQITISSIPGDSSNQRSATVDSDAVPCPPLEVAALFVTSRTEHVGCDGQAMISATMNTNGSPGRIRYRWTRNDGLTMPEETVDVGRGESIVTLPLHWRVSGVGDFRGVAAFEILEPAASAGLRSSTRFTYHCA
ncbi:hypothetical protein [Microbispora rosea]|uniref:hypothetical protein n=1 Tax=Microbispora rosea TaxID=58117 RepID=UPI00379DE355